MSRTLYQYRIFCVTEAINVTLWDIVSPTKCPHSIEHEINLNSVAIIDKISDNVVKIEDEDSPTQGNFRTESHKFIIPAMSTSSMTLSWKYQITVMVAKVSSGEINRGDVINTYVAEHTTVGVLTSNINAGVTIIPVSPTVMTNANIGYNVRITNGIHTDELGEIIAKDYINNSITVDASTQNAFSAGSYIQMTVRKIKNYEFSEPCYNVIGSSKITGSSLPANVPVRVEYQNNGQTDKTFIFTVEYLY